jgi:hypothetical protein
MSENPAIKPVDNVFAAIMTMMLPGLGQLLKGQIMPGIFWALAVGFGYFAFFWPGLIIHGLCILDAAFSKGEGSGNKKTILGLVTIITITATLIIYIYIRNF